MGLEDSWPASIVCCMHECVHTFMNVHVHDVCGRDSQCEVHVIGVHTCVCTHDWGCG